MARFSYDSYVKKEDKATIGEKGDYKVSYFSLKDDGDEAVVRFTYDSTDQFHLVTVHTVEEDGKFRRVSCLRTAREPLDKCPLCAAGEKVYDKFYVKLIQYETNSIGQVVAKAKVWERPASFSRVLENYLVEYGPLSDIVFKIKRRGVRGDMKTTYDIIYANPVVYKPEIYVKDFSDFEGYDLDRFFYTKRTVEEMNEYLKTGLFPRQDWSTHSSTTPEPIKPTTSIQQQSVQQQPVKQEATPPFTEDNQPSFDDFDSVKDTFDPTAQRPRRYTY